MLVSRNFFIGIPPIRKSPSQNHLIVSSAAFGPPPSFARLYSKSPHLPRTASIEPEQEQHQKRVWRRQHRDLLLDTFHQNHQLRKLLSELSDRDSDPLGLLEKHEDWDANQFWLVATFLVENHRVDEVLQVFDGWTKRETSRINANNYSKIIQLLSKEGSMESAMEAFVDMERNRVPPSAAIYNFIVTGFAKRGEFEHAKEAIGKMEEIGVMPTAETYNGLLRAYGEHKMYDEMSKCVKKMGLDGCSSNELTYNLLIVEFAKGGLFERMEGVHRTLSSKRMKLLPSTLVVMLEAYADVGILEKMEAIYRRILKGGNWVLNENLIRKMGIVYIENYRFGRLQQFGNELRSMTTTTGKTDLLWCLQLIASARLRTQKGLDSVLREMENSNVKPSITLTNTLALSCLKMKDFGYLNVLLCRIGEKNMTRIKPDMVTVGVLFDACNVGFDGSRSLDIWKRRGFLDQVAEIRTDPLVLAAFGKGSFLARCEDLFTALVPEDREKKKTWTYSDLLHLLFSKNR